MFFISSDLLLTKCLFGFTLHSLILFAANIATIFNLCLFRDYLVCFGKFPHSAACAMLTSKIEKSPCSRLEM